MKKYKISNISYLNTLPFQFGLENFKFSTEFKIQIIKDIPSACAEKLFNNQVDIGIVPVGSILDRNDFVVISQYCIASNDIVKSVILASQVPINDIHSIYLDSHSRTSNILVKVLAGNFWKIEVEFLNPVPDYLNHVNGNKAGVIIGDRALNSASNYKYVYDLAHEWNKYTDLPFVFALWVAKKKPDEKFIKEFNSALKLGINNIKYLCGDNKFLFEYLTKNIDYILSEDKHKALSIFMKYSKEFLQ
ncbi:MAG: menaquinone biosynthesis protein [Bacteroidota bacterium]